jgi:hypothetical protein
MYHIWPGTVLLNQPPRADTIRMIAQLETQESPLIRLISPKVRELCLFSEAGEPIHFSQVHYCKNVWGVGNFSVLENHHFAVPSRHLETVSETDFI